jgi:hypothetical protein
MNLSDARAVYNALFLSKKPRTANNGTQETSFSKPIGTILAPYWSARKPNGETDL